MPRVLLNLRGGGGKKRDKIYVIGQDKLSRTKNGGIRFY